MLLPVLLLPLETVPLLVLLLPLDTVPLFVDRTGVDTFSRVVLPELVLAGRVEVVDEPPEGRVYVGRVEEP